MAAGGATIESLVSSEQKLGFKINSSENLDHYIQDYLIDGAKVTFHSRNEGDRPKAQIDFLKSAPKVVVSKGCFDVLGIDGLLVMKSIVVYDRVKSRDIYDLMVLTRNHGYTLEDIFAAIDAYQPIRNKDPDGPGFVMRRQHQRHFSTAMQLPNVECYARVNLDAATCPSCCSTFFDSKSACCSSSPQRSIDPQNP